MLIQVLAAMILVLVELLIQPQAKYINLKNVDSLTPLNTANL
jgi:hypothetical protein